MWQGEKTKDGTQKESFAILYAHTFTYLNIIYTYVCKSEKIVQLECMKSNSTAGYIAVCFYFYIHINIVCIYIRCCTGIEYFDNISETRILTISKL